MKNSITPCLWFDQNAEEAVKSCTSFFKESKIIFATYYGNNAPMPKETVLTIFFQLNRNEFMALNGSPPFKSNETISLMVNCDTQKEIDYYWENLSSGGGKEVECGWVKDKFGLSWQIVPSSLGKMFKSKDEKKKQRMLQAVWSVKKMDIKKIKREFERK